MNDALIQTALHLLAHPKSDSLLRGDLLKAGYSLDDTSLHLEYMMETGLAAPQRSPGGTIVWQIKLRGKELRDRAARPPIGFRIS